MSRSVSCVACMSDVQHDRQCVRRSFKIHLHKLVFAIEAVVKINRARHSDEAVVRHSVDIGQLHVDGDDGTTAVTAVMGLNFMTNTAVIAGVGTVVTVVPRER